MKRRIVTQIWNQAQLQNVHQEYPQHMLQDLTLKQTNMNTIQVMKTASRVL